MEENYLFEEEAYQTPDGKRWELLHRLDGPTSGCILVCGDPEVARLVKMAFAGKRIQKTYEALVKGSPIPRQGSWKDCLETRRQSGQLRTFRVQGKPNSITGYRVIGAGRVSGTAVHWIELKPATGRTHQLRVQTAARGLPILGDATYGDFAFNRRARLKRLYLHARKIELQLEVSGQTVHFAAESPTPWDLAKLSSPD